MSDRPEAPGEVYDPGSARPTFPEPPGPAEPPDAAWPPTPYVPGTGSATGTAGDGDAQQPDESSSLARLLRERLGTVREGASDTRRVAWAALAEPDLRRRVLERLEPELRARRPELLVPVDDDARGLTTALADRTELPLAPVAGEDAPDRGGAGRGVALVGSVLRASAVANVVRTVEEGGDDVVAIVGIAARDGGDLAMLDEHYNIFSIITL